MSYKSSRSVRNLPRRALLPALLLTSAFAADYNVAPLLARLAASADKAPAIVIEEVRSHPKELAAIVQAAVAAQPKQAPVIVGELLKAFPKEFAAIVPAAIRGQPKLAREILVAALAALPGKAADILEAAREVAAPELIDEFAGAGPAPKTPAPAPAAFPVQPVKADTKSQAE